MTPKQESFLSYVKEFYKKHKIIPTYEEIMKDTGLKSKASVHRYLHLLEQEGLLKIKTAKARGIEFNDRRKSKYLTDLRILAQKVLELSPEHREWLETNFKEYL